MATPRQQTKHQQPRLRRASYSPRLSLRLALSCSRAIPTTRVLSSRSRLKINQRTKMRRHASILTRSASRRLTTSWTTVSRIVTQRCSPHFSCSHTRSHRHPRAGRIGAAARVRKTLWGASHTLTHGRWRWPARCQGDGQLASRARQPGRRRCFIAPH